MTPLVAQVPPELAPRYLGFVQTAMEQEVFTETLLYTAEDIIKAVMQQKLALFVFYELEEFPFLFAAVRIDSYPQGRTATIIALAGARIRAAISWRKGFEDWCRIQGVDHIYFNTNEKLARIMSRFGYRTKSVAVYKPLMTLN